MAFLMYKKSGYTVPDELLFKNSLKNGDEVNDFSIINDKEFYDSFVEGIHYFKWHLDVEMGDGRVYMCNVEAIDQDEAKLIKETESPDCKVLLVCDFWDHRKMRRKY
ncbi:MAG: hypothetical protein AB7E13_09435 [Arcobacteraceae bacterium]